MDLDIISAIGNTPTVLIQGTPSYYAKLEGLNPFGSIKDRAAAYVLKKGYEDGIITSKTEIIESSSGNFAVALSAVCHVFKNKFICVVDKNLAPINKMILQSHGTKIIVADKADQNGSFLSHRLNIVHKLIDENKNLYWVNQYDNEYIRKAYYETIGYELCNRFSKIDYLFVAVSTCGTISGLSKRVKEKYPSIKVIAVDVLGSKIFCNTTSDKRHIPGMGASIVPGNLSHAFIDDIVCISEKAAINHCRKLLKQGIFAGGSSGAVSAAIEKYANKIKSDDIVVSVFPDRGERYLSTIYNDEKKKNMYGLML